MSKKKLNLSDCREAIALIKCFEEKEVTCDCCGKNFTYSDGDGCGICDGKPLCSTCFQSEKDYIPVCPRGYKDCVCDPAYIKFYHPEWYKELYGDLTPEEAIMTENDCYEKFTEDPDEKYPCYDDEDK